MIQAKIIADSKNEFGNRITTMMVTFPRFILAELNTHRMFSRNSASSRAIPFERMVKSVQENPFVPIAWQKDHKGMQSTEYFGDEEITYTPDKWLGEPYTGSTAKLLTWLWRKAATLAVGAAKALSFIGVTKQICNRLLEPIIIYRSQEINTILSRYKASNAYVFPLLEAHWKEQKIFLVLKSLRGKIKRTLTRIGKSVGINQPIPHGTSRQCFANALKQGGASTDYISEKIGHSSTAVTSHYLKAFEEDTNYQSLLSAYLNK